MQAIQTSKIAIDKSNFTMLLRANRVCSMRKPQSASVLDCLLCAIDIFLSLFNRIVLEIEFEFLAIEPREIG